MLNQSYETAQCSCSTTELQISGKPLFRGYCHCTSCQEYTGLDYADVTIFRATDVLLKDDDSVSFKTYQKPPLVQRGKCVSCHAPTCEKVSMPLLPNLVIISTNILPVSLTIESAMHIFYNRRVEDVTDNLPKHSGFLKSQAVFMGALCKSLWNTVGGEHPIARLSW